ncbi:F-actin-capping protein subunit alpha [Lepeophtheirus salmonis]|uniref:F-actin-capping protein subunit alpha n=1 Tax=Lepeophtheirus salmonis TaxID=72036 RepID=D3PFK9_LEPSM|nr:F-actin-capping protein subunit alpha-like [Lepeophtheirus salmonis]ADD24055.1 F-actin-capping protein subunit alpha [Lepeophtheirus salmonis]ADD38602.1 F-actin-capping protein subunit alpha [Lepeophtheirus salmonis]
MGDPQEDTPVLSDTEKVRITSDFLLHSPPGEFNEVFNDVRVLLNNDTLLKEGASGAFSRYNKDQLTPVRMEGGGYCLITEYNDLGGGRFYDARSCQSFKYDHLRKEASDYQPHTPDKEWEPLRAAIETEATSYTLNHFKHGICCTFIADSEENGKSIVVCIEDHQFQPKNYWNGRWRSRWSIKLSDGEVTGLLKVQVHYYEDGNVQLVTSKEVKDTLNISAKDNSSASNLAALMERYESEYQTAISENYQTMSDTTFKALRRQLPVTRTKIDWNKIVSYSIGKELKTQ